VRRAVLLLGLAVAGCRSAESAGSGGEPAAVDAPKPWIGGAEIVSNDGDFRVVYKIADGPVRRGETFAIDAWVFAADAPEAPRTDVSLAVDAAMPQHGHGMNRVPRVENLGAGRFHIDGLDFHMPGRWELYFDVARQALVERAQADVEVE
jgi:hypothetical protein